MSRTCTTRLPSSIRYTMRYVPRRAPWQPASSNTGLPTRWIARKPGIAKLQYSGSNSFRKPVGDRWCSPALPCQSSCCPGQLKRLLAVPAEQSLVEIKGRSCHKRADLPVILPTFEETTLSGGVARNDFGVESTVEPLGGQP